MNEVVYEIFEGIISFLYVVGGCALGFALGLSSSNLTNVLFEAISSVVAPTDRTNLNERFELAAKELERSRAKWMMRAFCILAFGILLDIIIGVVRN